MLLVFFSMCIALLTTNLLLTFSKICFSLRAIDSPFLFLIDPLLLQFLTGIHLPRGSNLAGTHLRQRRHAFRHCCIVDTQTLWVKIPHEYCELTSPNPPFPSTLYCLNVSLVIGCLKET